MDLGISGPYGAVTDANGVWTISGSYGTSEAGSWQAQAVIRNAASAETSAPVTMQIYNT